MPRNFQQHLTASEYPNRGDEGLTEEEVTECIRSRDDDWRHFVHVASIYQSCFGH